MSNNFTLLLASRLYKLRRQADLKQNETATKLGLIQQSYSKLERGDLNFTDEIIDKICNLFNVKLEQFINVDNGSYSNSVLNSANSIYHNNSNKVIEDLISALNTQQQQAYEEKKELLTLLKQERELIQKLMKQV